MTLNSPFVHDEHDYNQLKFCRKYNLRTFDKCYYLPDKRLCLETMTNIFFVACHVYFKISCEFENVGAFGMCLDTNCSSAPKSTPYVELQKSLFIFKTAL